MSNSDHRKRVEMFGGLDCDAVTSPKLDSVLKSMLPKEAIKANGYLSRLSQFWLNGVTPQGWRFETAEVEELSVDSVIEAVQSALVLMDNAHQKMAQGMLQIYKILLDLPI